MNNLIDVFDTKTKDFGNTVSIVTTSAAAGIAVSKAIQKDQKIGALVGVGLGLLAYALFKPSPLKKQIENEINEGLDTAKSIVEKIPTVHINP